MTISRLIAEFIAFTLTGLFAYGLGELLAATLAKAIREDR